MSNIAAIVGRPNVGKSTLFNRLTQQKKAIIHESSGVTRDRHYGKSVWNGIEFSLIDTGGYVVGSDDIFEDEIRKQVDLAIDESDVILFVVDVMTGITDLDESVAKILRKIDKPIFLVVNKVDNSSLQYDANIFYKLGLKDLFNISSINGSGTGDFLDKVVESFPVKDNNEEESELPKFAVVGRPNAGKSSLINALIGLERNIVTPVSGTTRDSINTHYNKFGHDFILVDTAGIRKKSKVSENIEFYSVMRAIRAIENSDVCLLIIDALRGVEAQDLSIYSLIQKNSKGVVVLINKWDLYEKNTNSIKKYEENIREKLAPFNDVPILFISALTKQRIFKALETSIKVFENRRQRISTPELNRVMLKEIENYQPPAHKGKYIKIKFVTQLPTHAPTFAFFCNFPKYIKDSYKRYLENKLRSHYDFTGVPLKLFFRNKSKEKK
ncbi:MAG: ribosome biogenesis GTPase Der [Bacteroidales bacterium]|nr:ribosome biogenesis GTPase Der [Bacteroidales bacterium]